MGSGVSRAVKSHRGRTNLFKASDLNKNGKLDLQELKAAAEREGIGCGDNDIRRVMQMFDTNHDNELDLEEFKHALGHLENEKKSDVHEVHEPHTRRGLSPNFVIVEWRDDPDETTVIIDSFAPGPQYAAISHRWDDKKLDAKVTVRHRHGNVEPWEAKVQTGLGEHVCALLLGGYAGVFQDQVCIRQDLKRDHPPHREPQALKDAQISGMGGVYRGCTTVVCLQNGLEGFPSTEDEQTRGYWHRAWTQQEFTYGRVVFSKPPEKENPAAVIKAVFHSFINSDAIARLLEPVFVRVKDEPLNYRRKDEEGRMNGFLEHLEFKRIPAFQQQCKQLWEDGVWERDLSKAAMQLLKFRAECLWVGEAGISANMTSKLVEASDAEAQCYFPKDQLFGCYGVLYEARTGGGGLPYKEPNVAWRSVLREVYGMSFLKVFNDGDALGVFTEGKAAWVNNVPADEGKVPRHPRNNGALPDGYSVLMGLTPLPELSTHTPPLHLGSRNVMMFAVQWNERIAFGVCWSGHPPRLWDLFLGVHAKETHDNMFWAVDYGRTPLMAAMKRIRAEHGDREALDWQHLWSDWCYKGTALKVLKGSHAPVQQPWGNARYG